MHRYIVIGCVALLSCVSVDGEYSDVFTTPQSYVRKQVEVCGYMVDSSNIVESSDREDRSRAGGLSILESGPLQRLHRGRICVAGVLEHVGCGGRARICTDMAFDYGIRIVRVLSYR